jgi:mono/diheme cytochrome c family protein
MRCAWVGLAVCLVGFGVHARVIASAAESAPPIPILQGRLIASGIPGAGAVAQIGTFHAGGPVHDLPAFAAYTVTGKILDPRRVMVASSSNFGAPRIDGMPAGSLLSIDPNGEALRIPAAFAAAGGQVAAFNGRVQLFSASSPGFVNGVNTPKAVTAEFPAVSDPTGISINDAFGRPWVTSAQQGAAAPGLVAVIDPTGIPLANAPSQVAGGIFSGSKTNRSPQLLAGALATGIIANALLGRSPDGSKRATFAVLAADGSISQAHVELGVDGLAPRGTITPQTGALVRAGMVFNWVPNKMLFITDAPRNAIVTIPIADDTHIFTAGAPRLIKATAFHGPVDLAPAVPEVANGVFSSNTTLAGNSDIYVLNADGTIARIHQDGRVVAVRRVSIAGHLIGANRLNGITTASDASRLWLTVRDAIGSEAPGALIEVPAFGAITIDTFPAATIAAGKALFFLTLTPQTGLGPLFNDRSCIACHSMPTAGGMGPNGLDIVTHIGRLEGGIFDPMTDTGGPIARAHSVNELGFACPLTAGISARANVTSLRNAPVLYDDGAIDALTDTEIAAGAVTYPDGVHGRPNWVDAGDGVLHVGRFGWKSEIAHLATFVGQALRNEMGVTNPFFPRDLASTKPPEHPCAGESAKMKDDGTQVRQITAYVATLKTPDVANAPANQLGRDLFASTGCEECHTARFHTGSAPLYSDFLIHDMGPNLDDGIIQGQAQGVDWRTTALHGAGLRKRFMHDGRALTIAAAIVDHDGEATSAVGKYRALDAASKRALIDFVDHL